MNEVAAVEQASRTKSGRTAVGVKVLVLAGGRSAERDVSLASGAAVSQALHEAGYEVFCFDPGVSQRVVGWSADAGTARIGTAPPQTAAGAMAVDATARIAPADLPMSDLKEIDVVFIAMHGGAGEDGHLQAILDLAGVRYIGSGMAASVLAMDKNSAKRIFVAEGIPTPQWRVIDSPDEYDFDDIKDVLGLPVIVKPNAQGSTVGLTLVKEKSQWRKALAEGFRWDRRLILEEYIAGREVTVGILGDEALPVIEIFPKHGIYDYECKYTAGQSEHICPAQLPAKTARMLQEQGLEAFRALGCFGFARVDFRLSDDGQPYCLEVNTLPGMTATSLVPKAAQAAGIEFPVLVRRICELARGRS